MLDMKFIRDNKDIVNKAIKDRGLELDIEGLLSLDQNRRQLLTEVEKLRHQKKVASEQIGSLLKEKKDASAQIQEVKTQSQKIKELDTKVDDINQKIGEIMLNIPNIPHNSVPIGSGREANKIVREGGEIPRFKFTPRTHLELGEILGLFDFARSSKIVGSNFALYVGEGARLERALINFMLDLHTKKHNYKEIWPSYLVNRASMTSTGQLPKLEEDMYRLRDDDYFLIPTAEVPLTNLHRDEVLEEEELPIYYVSYTACFRREAGSYGKETRGLVRVHQFDKVELVKFVKPENSYDELESLLRDAEEVIQLLELPYRIVLLCTGELSFAGAKCYDIELYAPGLNRWLEVSSCSNFTDFQSRRANIKYRTKSDLKTQYVHTLNGSGVALARLVVALLEVHQREDGSVLIPKALRPYFDNTGRLEPTLRV